MNKLDLLLEQNSFVRRGLITLSFTIVSVEWLGYTFGESIQIRLGNRKSQKGYYLNMLFYWLASLHHHHNGSKWLYGQILRVQITYWPCDLGQDTFSLSASTSSFVKWPMTIWWYLPYCLVKGLSYLHKKLRVASMCSEFSVNFSYLCSIDTYGLQTASTRQYRLTRFLII